MGHNVMRDYHGNTKLWLILVLYMNTCLGINMLQKDGMLDDFSRHRRSFASFRFRPKSLESLMMINKAYKMMDNIDDIVSSDYHDQKLPNDEELKEMAKLRVKDLLSRLENRIMEEENLQQHKYII